MRPLKSPLVAAASLLSQALERETRAARCGALTELTDAAAAKQTAFAEFQALRPQESCEDQTAEEREALRGLLAAANENAVVLEAVKLVLDATATRLQAILGSMADPGVYRRAGAPARHVMAARINAIA